MAPNICKVCEQLQSKYKCPSCRIPYCSLGCYKKHKEIPCGKQPEPEKEKEKQKITPADELQDERPYYVDDSGEVLQQVQLESVVSSREIQDAIQNEQIQKLIYNINFSADAESEMTNAMQDDSFRIFTEKILSVVNGNATNS
ncbi:hypothetical protein Leryth_023001 [Lithospermum erythrorhizon]|nr:hypothetical protein Leryth_023001 [Lithospermum erythrorhizon]